MTIVFDFDGTLSENTWPLPALGKPITLALDAMRFYANNGYEIIVYTARPASHATAIWKWLDDNLVRHLVYDVICDKPLAALYIDDRALRFPEGLS